MWTDFRSSLFPASGACQIRRGCSDLRCRIRGGRAATLGAPMLSEVRFFGAVVRPIQAFVRTEASSGVLLLGCAIAALVWANLDPTSYRATFEHPLTIGTGQALSTF